MQRPLLYAAVLVLAGTLTGLNDCSVGMRLAAAGAAFLLLLPIFNKKQIVLMLFLLCFAAGFFRASFVSYRYRKPEAAAFFERFRATNPGQFDYSLYLKGQGIANDAAYEAYQERREASAVKTFCADGLSEGFGETDAGLYRAILLGDKSEMDTEIRDLYQTSGISHLLAVSGLHVGILGLGLTELLKRLRLRPVLRILTASVLLIGYTILCGAQASTLRAVIMLILSLTAAGCYRNYCMRSAVSLSLILILLYHPYQVFAGGFQLSFGAVLAISVVGMQLTRGAERFRAFCRPSGNPFQKRIPKRDRLPMWLKTLLMSAAIQLTLLPIMAWHSFTFAPYGIVLNLLVIPLMAGVIYSGLAVIGVYVLLRFLLCLCSVLPLGSLNSGLQSALRILMVAAGAPGHWILAFYEGLCRAAQRLPGAEVCIGRPGLGRIVLYYAVLLLVCGLSSGEWKSAVNLVRELFGRSAERCGRDTERAHLRIAYRIRHTPVLKAVIPCLVVLLLIGNAMLLPPKQKKTFSCTMLDVGQGDGFVITDGGTSILIDGGSTSNKELGSRVLLPYLQSQRMTHIERAVVSHADLDHYSGILYLLTDAAPAGRVRIDELVLPAASLQDEAYAELIDAAGAVGTRIHCLTNGEKLKLSDDCTLSCIYAGAAAPTEDRNRESSVLLLTKGDLLSVLFTGDASSDDDEVILKKLHDWQAEEETPAAQVSILKAAHHGSSTGSSEVFLDAVRPDYVLLSYKKKNRYGHPAAEVVDRFEKRGIGMYASAERGAVTLQTKKKRVMLRCLIR